MGIQESYVGSKVIPQSLHKEMLVTNNEDESINKDTFIIMLLSIRTNTMYDKFTFCWVTARHPNSLLKKGRRSDKVYLETEWLSVTSPRGGNRGVQPAKSALRKSWAVFSSPQKRF